MSSASSQKEHLKAACSDLERIRRIKKEAEFLEVSFRTKAAFLQQVSFCCLFQKEESFAISELPCSVLTFS